MLARRRGPTGAFVTFGLMAVADASAVAEAVVGASAMAIQALISAGAEQAVEARRIERDRLFFLYRAETALQRG